MELHQKLSKLVAKVCQLKEQNRKLSQAEQKLDAEVKQLKNKLEAETQKTLQLHNQIKIIKLAQNISSNNNDGTDMAELKKKISEYIREVDQCMALLND